MDNSIKLVNFRNRKWLLGNRSMNCRNRINKFKARYRIMAAVRRSTTDSFMVRGDFALLFCTPIDRGRPIGVFSKLQDHCSTAKIVKSY